MSPVRKRVAIAIILVGGALIAERVVSLTTDDNESGATVSQAVQGRRARADAGDSSSGTGANSATASEARVRLDRLALRAPEAASAAGPSTQAALFKTVSWLPSAPKVAPPPPPKPVPPPFPYPYVGGLTEDGVRTTFFTKGSRVLPVKAGDTIDAVFRVDQMTEDHMTLTYLPLNEPIEVALGDRR